MADKGKPTLLCVDDEPQVLEGLKLHLRKRFEVATATSGAEGVEFVAKNPNVAVVISDMRMPNMDGATFLAKTRAMVPDATRMLLTGHAGLESAISAVNDGQIFRFLVKPCPPPQLLAAAEAAAEQHRLVTSEKVLLEQTLRGAIKTMTEILAFTSPTSFGRATRVRRTVCDLAERVKVRGRWQIEVAAMLSQLATMTLPHDTAARIQRGQDLDESDQALVQRLPAITEQLLGHIPRLEAVRAMLAYAARPAGRVGAPSEDPHKAAVERGAQLLRLAIDFDILESSGSERAVAISILRGRGDIYAPDLLEALAHIQGQSETRDEVREATLATLVVGMVLAEDILMTNDVLFVARGHEVTEEFLLRARNFKGSLREPFRVIVQRKSSAEKSGDSYAAVG